VGFTLQSAIVALPVKLYMSTKSH